MLEPQQYAEGLHQKMSQVAEFLHEDLDKTLKNVEGVKRGAQNLAEKLQDKAQEVKEVAQVKVAELKRQPKPEAESAPPAAGAGEVTSPVPPGADLD